MLSEEINYCKMFNSLIEKIMKPGSDIKNLVEEIYEYHQAAPLNQIELDSTVDVFEKIYTSLDDESINMMLGLFVNCIITRKIKPKHGFVLESTLTPLLKKHSSMNEKYPYLRKNIFLLMGNYKLKKPVIDQLKKDAQNLENPLSVESDYTDDSLSTIVLESLNELLDLRLELKQGDKVEAARLIKNVMYHFREPIDNKDNIQ